jgi:hypothetical protein
LLEGQQAMFGDGHAMGVASQIAQHLQGPTEGRLGINDPVVVVQAAEEFCELLRIGQGGRRTGAAELVTAVEFLPKDTGLDDRQLRSQGRDRCGEAGGYGQGDEVAS